MVGADQTWQVRPKSKPSKTKVGRSSKPGWPYSFAPVEPNRLRPDRPMDPGWPDLSARFETERSQTGTADQNLPPLQPCHSVQPSAMSAWFLCHQCHVICQIIISWQFCHISMPRRMFSIGPLSTTQSQVEDSATCPFSLSYHVSGPLSTTSLQCRRKKYVRMAMPPNLGLTR